MYIYITLSERKILVSSPTSSSEPEAYDSSSSCVIESAFSWNDASRSRTCSRILVSNSSWWAEYRQKFVLMDRMPSSIRFDGQRDGARSRGDSSSSCVIESAFSWNDASRSRTCSWIHVSNSS